MILPAVSLILLFVLGCLLVFWALSTGQKWSKIHLAPLVPGLPYLGNVVGFDTKNPHRTLMDWAKKYGDVYRIKLLGENIVVVNSKDLIRDALITKSQDFAGRPYLFRILYGFHYSRDIIFETFTERWAELKKLASQALRSYGSGTPQVESMMKEEMRETMRVLQRQSGRDTDPTLILSTAVVNVISGATMGTRFDWDDPRMKRYHTMTRLFSECCSAVEGIELDLFPWLRFFPSKNFNKLRRARNFLDQLVDDEFADLKGRYDPDNITCIVEALMKARDQRAEGGLQLTDVDVRNIFIDILISGTLTTAIALNVFVLLMACHQDIQSKVQDEIARTLDKTRLPEISDREKMPLMEAAILELLRYQSHVPLCLPHYTTTDTELGGYDIPRNTQVLLNLWALHHDERIWTDPWQFRPSRFLDECGQVVSPNSEIRKSLLPFGAGRRMCMGESLARERLFLFATCILHHFKILPPEGVQTTSCDPRDFQLGLILEPKPFSVRFIQRA